MGNYTVTAICVVPLYFAILSGCSTSPVTASQNQVPPPAPFVVSNNQTESVNEGFPGLKTVVANEYLLDSIKLINPKIGKKGDFTRAQITVKNLTQNRYELEYQYQWEDQQGFAVGTPRPWNRFALGPKELRNISELALERDAKQVIFTVRLVDDSFIKETSQPQVNQYNQP